MDIMSADEVFEQNGWVKGTENLFTDKSVGTF
ncbi:hypothetical protein XBI1_2920025 [Xenorhabdus bovienii str. Intermedium]|uniref:Uncharacterized protein n=1 Tax=Xenorhabdus bovienii str. Intermedium TaxID=1379677 RepID=A0A077QL92_XENBV|nr:hypothetical protein XBI1_2920025 [Xenorhabdus bovienii str. Intermedium]